jgi:hypothetical protein
MPQALHLQPSVLQFHASGDGQYPEVGRPDVLHIAQPALHMGLGLHAAGDLLQGVHAGEVQQVGQVEPPVQVHVQFGVLQAGEREVAPQRARRRTGTEVPGNELGRCPGRGEAGREFPLHVLEYRARGPFGEAPVVELQAHGERGARPFQRAAVVHRQVGTAVHAVAAQGSPQPVRQQLHHAGQVQPEAVGAQVHMAALLARHHLQAELHGRFPEHKFTLVDLERTGNPAEGHRQVHLGLAVGEHRSICVAPMQQGQIAFRGERGAFLTETSAQAELVAGDGHFQPAAGIVETAPEPIEGHASQVDPAALAARGGRVAPPHVPISLAVGIEARAQHHPGAVQLAHGLFAAQQGGQAEFQVQVPRVEQGVRQPAIGAHFLHPGIADAEGTSVGRPVLCASATSASVATTRSGCRA